MSQIGSNAAGEVFADFKLNPDQALEALRDLESKAVSSAKKVEDSVGEKGGMGAKKLSSEALAAAGAVGAVLAATDKVLKAIGEWNAASANLAKNYRAIDEAAGSLTTQLGNAQSNFDELAKQATNFGQKQIEELAKVADQWDVATLARKLYADIAGVELEEEAQIEQILNRRRQLLESIGRAREEAFTANVEERDRKRRNEEELRLANALNDLEKQRNAIRKEGFTEQQKQVDSLRETIAVINDLLATTDNPQTAQALGEYAKFFADRLDVVMQPVIEDLAEKFARSVQEKFAGVFDTGSLTDQFGNVTGKLDAIVAQLQTRGML